MRPIRRRIVTAALMFAAAQASAQATPTPRPAILVSGHGEVLIAPDEASLQISVETQAATAAAAGADNARRYAAVHTALLSAGVAAGDLTGGGYEVQPVWQYVNGIQTRNGYRAVNSVRLHVTQLDKLGNLIDAALAAGATNVSDPEYETKQQSQARQQALTLAVANARADAEVLAKAAGGTLGALEELSTQTPGIEPGTQMLTLTAQKRANVPTEISSAQLQISAEVNARWAFLANPR